VSLYRYKMIVEYDGTNYAGWQIQPNHKTVQSEIQNMLKSIFREDIKLAGSGRTDSGVHALGQVCSFTSSSKYDCEEINYRLNRMLPDDIAVLKVSLTGLDFNPRYASSRVYRYYVAESPDVQKRHFRYRLNKVLDIDRLKRAANIFIGKHDFSAFCKQKSLKENNDCYIFKSDWFRYDRALIYEIEGNRFLHNMVRRIVGVMFNYEQKKITLTHIRKFLNNNEMVKYPVPANGLVLKEVKYGRIKR